MAAYRGEGPISPGLSSSASYATLSERGHPADASTLAEQLSNLDHAAEFGRDWKSANVNHRFTREGTLLPAYQLAASART